MRHRCCCAPPTCSVFNNALQESYTGTAFDDDWILLDDPTSTTDIDLTTLSSNAVVMSKLPANSDGIYSTYQFLGSGQVPAGKTSRIILLGSDVDTDNYIFFKFTESFSGLRCQAGYRTNGSDTLVGSAVDVKIPMYDPSVIKSLDVGYSQTLNGVTPGFFTACYNDSEGVARFGVAYSLDGVPGTHYRTLIEESITKTAEMGRRIGWSSSDWSDEGITGFGGGVATANITLSNDKVWETDCPECVDISPPGTDPQDCACLATSVTVTMKSVQYVLDLDDVSTPPGECAYKASFPVDCNPNQVAWAFPENYDCDSDWSGTTMDIEVRTTPSNPQAYALMKVTFTNGGTSQVRDLVQCGDPNDPAYQGQQICSTLDPQLEQPELCTTTIEYSGITGDVTQPTGSVSQASRDAHACSCIMSYFDILWCTGSCGIFDPANKITATAVLNQ